jgi:ankyrin repeat protein
MKIDTLPPEIRVKIFKYCDVDSLMSFGEAYPKYIPEFPINKIQLWFNAAKKGYCNILKVMIKNLKFDINLKDSRNKTALTYLTVSKFCECVELILRMGADPNIQDRPYGFTPLYWAIYNQDLECVVNLINARADVNIRSYLNNWTALHLAAEQKNPVIVTKIMRAGADINARDCEGRTPLFMAAIHGDEVIMSLLISVGADVNLKISHDGSRLIHWAAKQWPSILKMLVRGGAKVNVKNDDGETPLHLAVANSKITLNDIKALVDAGADIGAKDNEGRDVLYWAKAYLNVNIIGFLTQKIKSSSSVSK